MKRKFTLTALALALLGVASGVRVASAAAKLNAGSLQLTPGATVEAGYGYGYLGRRAFLKF